MSGSNEPRSPGFSRGSVTKSALLILLLVTLSACHEKPKEAPLKEEPPPTKPVQQDTPLYYQSDPADKLLAKAIEEAQSPEERLFWYYALTSKKQGKAPQGVSLSKLEAPIPRKPNASVGALPAEELQIAYAAATWAHHQGTPASKTTMKRLVENYANAIATRYNQRFQAVYGPSFPKIDAQTLHNNALNGIHPKEEYHLQTLEELRLLKALRRGKGPAEEAEEIISKNPKNHFPSTLLGLAQALNTQGKTSKADFWNSAALARKQTPALPLWKLPPTKESLELGALTPKPRKSSSPQGKNWANPLPPIKNPYSPAIQFQ